MGLQSNNFMKKATAQLFPMYYILLLFCFLIVNFRATAQKSAAEMVKSYYPTLEKLDGKKLVKHKTYSSTYINEYSAKGCVTGNCLDGEGSLLFADRVKDSTFPKDSWNQVVEPVVRLTLYKGRFGNAGRSFTGSVYSRKVYYDIDYTKNNAEAKLIPKVAYKLTDDSFWENYLEGTGSMESLNYSYKWKGWVDKPVVSGLGVDGMPTSYKVYIDTLTCYVNKTYLPGGNYKHLQGRTLPDGEFLGGRIRYADGSVYEGFLHAGKRIGPGRFTTASGIKKEGIWMLDTISTAIPVFFPDILFSPNPLLANGKAKNAIYNAGGGWAYYDNGSTIYLGKADSGKLNGVGIYIYQREGLNEWWTGNFVKGKQTSGLYIFEQGELDKVLVGFPYERTIKRNNYYGFVHQNENTNRSFLCRKMLNFDSYGNVTSMYEGFIDQGRLPQGWIFVNDWKAKREAESLQFLVDGKPYLSIPINDDRLKGHISWIKLADSGDFCMPEVNKVKAAFLPKITLRTDSLLAIISKEESAMAIRKADAEKRRAECLGVMAKYPYQPGEMVLLNYTDGHPNHVLITDKYNCDYQQYPVIRKYWITPKTGGGSYWSENSSVSPEALARGGRVNGLFAACGTCKGSGKVSIDIYKDVGGNSGYTDLGNGWARKNAESYYVSKGWGPCKGGCNGSGFMRR